MKILVILLSLAFIGIIIYFNQNKRNTESIQDNRIEITEDVEWSELEKIISGFDTDLISGKQNIIDFINSNYSNFNSGFLSQIDLNSIKTELNDYLINVVSKKPIEDEIKSLNFGLFESDFDNILCYVSGSNLNPKEDPDWASTQEYFPKLYLELSEFKIIRKELKKYKGNISDIEQLIINGFMNLVIANSIVEIDNATNNKKLNLGSGYDSGDIFIIREHK
ncbi:hypothetical protein [uncultured Maribacter sp.]|uniref:hypothetical protein n=1 Tax=uncultured Maribacter sp. TaxID=431308 RepID=UPI002601C082|nr:hypothetical protein [uncultured Maribacter sp.]